MKPQSNAVWVLHIKLQRPRKLDLFLCLCRKIESPFWCPTKMTTPSGVLEFPLKTAEYNFINSAGLQFEAADVRDCLQKGK